MRHVPPTDAAAHKAWIDYQALKLRRIERDARGERLSREIGESERRLDEKLTNILGAARRRHRVPPPPAMPFPDAVEVIF